MSDTGPKRSRATEKGPRVGSTSRVADTSQAPVAEQRAREARVPQPRTPPDAASSAPSIAEPMGDIDLLLTEIKRSQVDRRRAAFLSFYICFADRGRWEAAAAAAVAQQWQVASYSQAGSYVLRMSYSCKPTAERLQHLNDVVTAFADEQGGRWESLAIETAEPAGKWAQVT